MSREYDIKDILTEAASRDCADVKNVRWDPSDKHKKSMEKILSKAEKGGFFSSGLFKGLMVAAVIALFFGVSMAIRPVREPMISFFGNMFGGGDHGQTETAGVGSETEEMTEKAVIETETETETETEIETDTEEATETEYTAKTPEDWVDFLVETIASGDNSDKRWEALHSFGDVAVDHLVKRYFDGDAKSKIKAVISVFISEIVKDEVTSAKNGYFSDFEFPDRSALDKKTYNDLSLWLLNFRARARKYAKYTYEKTAKSKLPLTCRILLITDEKPFLYDPTGVDISVLLDNAISEDFNTQNASQIYNYLTRTRRRTAYQYCMDNYFTETDAMRRVAMSWVVYEIIHPEVSDLLGNERAISIYRGTENYDAAKKWNIKTHADVVEPFIQKYADEVKDIAENMLEGEMRDEYPFTYALLSAVGFDGYKPGEPDIAFRSRKAIKAASELYQAVNYGWVPDELVECCLPVEDYMRQDLTSYTKDDVSQYCPTEDFYGYFEKYIDKSIIDNACKTQNAWFTIKSGRVYMYDGGPQNNISIYHRSAKLLSQNGDTYVITADVHFPYGMFSYVRNLTFEVKEYEDGVRLTGGSFADRILTPEYGAVNYLASVLNMYFRLREGQIKFSHSTVCQYYYSYDEVPEEYRNVLTEDMEYPLYYGENLVFDSDGFKFEHGATEEIQEAILRKTDVFDGVALYPQHAKIKHTPKFDYEFDFQITEDYNATFSCIFGYDIALGMNVIESTPDSLYISLDFTKEENGKTEDVTYTFDIRTEYDTDNPNYSAYYVLEGGTFVTDVIFGQ